MSFRRPSISGTLHACCLAPLIGWQSFKSNDTKDLCATLLPNGTSHFQIMNFWKGPKSFSCSSTEAFQSLCFFKFYKWFHFIMPFFFHFRYLKKEKPTWWMLSSLFVINLWYLFSHISWFKAASYLSKLIWDQEAWLKFFWYEVHLSTSAYFDLLRYHGRGYQWIHSVDLKKYFTVALALQKLWGLGP